MSKFQSGIFVVLHNIVGELAREFVPFIDGGEDSVDDKVGQVVIHFARQGLQDGDTIKIFEGVSESDSDLNDYSGLNVNLEAGGDFPIAA